jgi:Na+-transporting NADH:ubiquinone oxidoreductase subunit NqrB
MLITLILVVGEWRFGAMGGYRKLVLTVGTCVLTELTLGLFIRGAIPPLQSAYISAMSLSLLVRPQAGLEWPFIAGAALSIGSKYVLRYRGKHLWNPSNFGIAALVLLAPTRVAILSHELGNDLLGNLVIWTVGMMVVWRAKVLHVTLTYGLSFIAFAYLRSVLLAVPFVSEVAPLTGPMYQLLLFFMLTDPPTTPSTMRKRIVSTVIIAAVECLFRLANDWHWPGAYLVAPAPPILALFLVGPITFGLDLRARSKAA